MSIFNELEFSDMPYVVLCECEKQNNWGCWSDYIFAIKQLDGSYTVTARKYTDSHVDGPTEQEWVTIHSVSSITSSESFLKAIQDCEYEIGLDLDWDEVLEKISVLDINLSHSIEKLLFDN